MDQFLWAMWITFILPNTLNLDRWICSFLVDVFFSFLTDDDMNSPLFYLEMVINAQKECESDRYHYLKFDVEMGK